MFLCKFLREKKVLSVKCFPEVYGLKLIRLFRLKS